MAEFERNGDKFIGSIEVPMAATEMSLLRANSLTGG